MKPLRQRIKEAEGLERSLLISKFICEGKTADLIDIMMKKPMTIYRLHFEVRRSHVGVINDVSILSDLGLIVSKERNGKFIIPYIDAEKVVKIRESVMSLNNLVPPKRTEYVGVLNSKDKWCACGRMPVCGFDCEIDKD